MRNSITSIASRLGIHVSKSTSTYEIAELAKRYWPVEPGTPLIRLGGSGDGGYLIPSCLDGISFCLSPGVDQTAMFEKDLETRGIGSHLIDASVDSPPSGFEPLTFTKKFLGPITNDSGKTITLADWMQEIGASAQSDALLQMDIEGAEYATLLSTPREIMRQFRIIVIELHNLNSLGNRAFLQLFGHFTEFLLKDHVVVHAHPNNIRKSQRVGDVMVHPFLELTLLRKTELPTENVSFTTSYPHQLDRACVPNNADETLSKFWYAAKV